MYKNISPISLNHVYKNVSEAISTDASLLLRIFTPVYMFPGLIYAKLGHVTTAQ